jgi:hypothetical protein
MPSFAATRFLFKTTLFLEVLIILALPVTLAGDTKTSSLIFPRPLGWQKFSLRILNGAEGVGRVLLFVTETCNADTLQACSSHALRAQADLHSSQL